jgi:hypothetical protein
VNPVDGWDGGGGEAVALSEKEVELLEGCLAKGHPEIAQLSHQIYDDALRYASCAGRGPPSAIPCHHVDGCTRTSCSAAAIRRARELNAHSHIETSDFVDVSSRWRGLESARCAALTRSIRPKVRLLDRSSGGGGSWVGAQISRVSKDRSGTLWLQVKGV